MSFCVLKGQVQILECNYLGRVTNFKEISQLWTQVVNSSLLFLASTLAWFMVGFDYSSLLFAIHPGVYAHLFYPYCNAFVWWVCRARNGEGQTSMTDDPGDRMWDVIHWKFLLRKLTETYLCESSGSMEPVCERDIEDEGFFAIFSCTFFRQRKLLINLMKEWDLLLLNGLVLGRIHYK